MEGLKEQLEQAITEGFKGLQKLEFGSEEYLQAAKGLKELYKLKIDEEIAMNEQSQKAKNEAEIRLKEEQLKLEEKKHNVEIRLKEEQLKLEEKKHEADISLKEEQIRNEEKRSKRIKPDVILSSIASTVTIIGILLYEKSDVLTTKAVNYVPKIKL